MQNDNFVSYRLNSSGFTIVELLIVIVIIGILASLTIVSYTGINQKATVASLESDLDNISKRLKLDQIEDSSYPITLDDANNGNGISVSPGTELRYSVDNTTARQDFCISAVKNDISYMMTNDSSPVEGDCEWFGLVMSLDAANTNSYSYPDSGTVWTDLSGNGYHGTLANGAVYSPLGGGSIDFDGIDDYVTCGTISPMSHYTIGTWVKMERLVGTGDQNTYGFTLAATSAMYGTWLTVGGAAGAEVSGRAFTTNTTGNPTVGANLNTFDWFYIVLTANIGSTAKVYVNGVERREFTTNATPWSGTLTIGDLRPNRLIGFDGLISNFKLYDRELSAAEIQQNFDDTRSNFGL